MATMIEGFPKALIANDFWLNFQTDIAEGGNL